MPESATVTTESVHETRSLGNWLGQRLRPGDLVLLHGSFGAGKTVLVQGIADALGIEDPVTSPSFVLMVEHAGRERLVHVDFFRIEHAADDLIAGLEEYLDAGWIVAIEWPDWLPDSLAGDATHVRIEPQSETSRQITLTSPRVGLLDKLGPVSKDSQV